MAHSVVSPLFLRSRIIWQSASAISSFLRASQKGNKTHCSPRFLCKGGELLKASTEGMVFPFGNQCNWGILGVRKHPLYSKPSLQFQARWARTERWPGIVFGAWETFQGVSLNLVIQGYPWSSALLPGRDTELQSISQLEKLPQQ